MHTTWCYTCEGPVTPECIDALSEDEAEDRIDSAVYEERAGEGN